MKENFDNYYLKRWGENHDWSAVGISKKKRFYNFLKFHSKYSSSKPEQRIMDYGCGSGWFLSHLHSYGYENLYAFDITPKVLEALKSKLPYIKSIWGLKNETSEDIPTNYFDICISSEVYEHIPYHLKEEYYDQIFRIIKPNGFFYLTTPNGKYKTNGIKKEFYQPIEDWSRPNTVIHELTKAGFVIIEKGSFHMASNLSLTHKFLFSNKATKLLDFFNLKNIFQSYSSRRMLGLSTYYYCKKI